MRDLENLSLALIETIKDSNIKEAFAEVSEASVDFFLDDGMLKEIPIIGTIYKLCNATLSIQDRLFTKKLVTFFQNFKNIPIEERRQVIKKIEGDVKYKTKVGEKLLYIIDKSEDSEKSAIIGKLFRALLESKIDYDDFLKACKCVELIHLNDLKRFVSENWANLDFEEAGDLVGAGLMKGKFEPGTLYHDGKSSGSIICTPSAIGSKLQELLK